jgi:hypothetical protein
LARKIPLLAILIILFILTTVSGCARSPGASESDRNNQPTATGAFATPSLTPKPTPTATPTPEPTPISPNVVIADQTLDESGVLIADEVALPAPGWLAIYRVIDGEPDEVIGHQPLTAGLHEDVEVSVDPAAATEALLAGVHMDVGAEGVFEYPGEDEPFPGEPETEFTVELSLPRPVVEVTEQTIGEDGVLTLARVELLEPTWVLIHSDEEGTIGPVVGGIVLDPGIYENVPLTIDWRRSSPTLYAVLHEDSGEARVLEYPGGDNPILQNGQPVVAAFKAFYPPEVLVYDQPIIDGAITVERAISDGPGWVVIYNESDGQPSFIIGSAPLEDGLNEQITVPLVESVVTPQLFARIHQDTQPGDAFNFPGQDPPVRYNNRLPRANAFHTDVSAHAMVRDQRLGDGNTLNVAVIVSAVDAWAAIYADAEGQPGELLGRAWVPAGINRDVVIEVEPAPEAGVVHLLLYEDLGQREEFEAPSVDLPLDNNDNRPVRIPFTVLPPIGG